MEIIVSHDVDHLDWSEHFWKDLYIPKLWFRSCKLMLGSVIDARTFNRRVNFWSDKRINRLNEVMAFESALDIPATYFFVMEPGLGVAYRKENAAPVIREVLNRGFGAGVHGMTFDNALAMQREFEAFKTISGLQQFGIRMHYLRNSEDTKEKLAAIGYAFDSTDYSIGNPYSIDHMVEFPISVMDVYSVRPQHKTMDIAIAYSLSKIEEAEKKNIPFFVINFHDMLFDSAYSLYRDWFTWIINLLKEKGYSFTSFEKAMKKI